MAKKIDRMDAMLDELLDGRSREEIVGKDGLMKQFQKRLIERVLETEMTEHLGYEPHESKGRGSGNSRNGKTKKTIKGEAGDVDIEVPRDRSGDFEPQLIPKRTRRLEGFDDKVIALYARGMPTREIQGHLHEPMAWR